MRYVALFRGINVGGKNIVKMQDLRALFSELGFQDVRSYIQSGNILFSSDSRVSEFSKRVEKAFAERFGFSVPIIYRTQAEMLELVKNLPYTVDEITEAESMDPQVAHLYVYFSAKEMKQQEFFEIGERAIVHSKDVYYLTDKSVRFSKLNTKLPTGLTARNWKTVMKLMSLLEE